MALFKRLSSVAAVTLCAGALTPAPIAAQTSVTGVISAGFAPAVGTTADYLRDGWTLSGGVLVHPKPASPFALQFDFSYSYFQATHNLIDLEQAQSAFRIDDGYGSVWSLTAAGRYTQPFSPRVNGYGLLGIGVYNRYVAMTQTALGYGYVCDPWWGFCYPGLVAGDLIVADTSQTKFGWNVGVGLEFPIPYRGAWFVEARYHRIEGTNSTEFVPIQIGYRF